MNAQQPFPARGPGRFGPVRGVVLGIACALAVLPPAAAEPRRSLPSVLDTAEAGAPGFALTLIDRHQPEVTRAPSSWARWQRARIDILGDAGAWARALDYLTDPPTQAPADFVRWARERRAEVHLERGEPALALNALRRLLWRTEGATTEARVRWRRLIIRSYLAADRVGDAVVAMRRFEQDHEGGEGWERLRARVLIRAERWGEALDVLPNDASGELQALRLYAELAGETRDPTAVAAEARAALDANELADANRARFQAVIVHAAEQRGAILERALASARNFAAAPALRADAGLFRIPADEVWQAWLDWGQREGNERNLLLGDDDAWLAAADEALPEYSNRARALLAVAALRGSDRRAEAHERWVEQWIEEGPGAGFVRRLYLQADRFGGVAGVPTVVRYRLVDEALADNDLATATELLRGLDEAPPDRDRFNWRLLRARVLALGGEPEAGQAVLERLLADHRQMAPNQLDRVLQVIFDLQGADDHQRALELLARIGEYELPGQRRRELLYWKAQSEAALGRHRRAAELYLRSATLIDGQGGDRWGQTARYQAAQQLAKIGLINDARRIYSTLLRVTQDEARRAQLRNRLQRLGLREAGDGDLPLPRVGE